MSTGHVERTRNWDPLEESSKVAESKANTFPAPIPTFKTDGPAIASPPPIPILERVRGWSERIILMKIEAGVNPYHFLPHPPGKPVPEDGEPIQGDQE